MRMHNQPAQKRLRSVVVAIVCAVLATTLGIQSAYADMFGGDLPILTQIMSTGFKQLSTATQTAATLTDLFSETKKLVTYAGDGLEAYREITSFTAGRAGNSALQALYKAYPEASFLQSQLTYGSGSWLQGYGGYSPELRSCIDSIVIGAFGNQGSAGCSAWEKAVSAEKLRGTVEGTFGKVPASRPELQLVRDEDLRREAQYQAEQVNKAKVEKLVYDKNEGMLAKCLSANNPAVCQTLAAQAEIRGLEQQAETNRKLEELIHQQTVANELKIQEATREELEGQARRTSLTEGLRAFGWTGDSTGGK